MTDQKLPPGVDPSKPSIAGVYDALLGGHDHLEIDRLVAQEMIDSVPGVVEAPRYNRAALVRAIHHLTTEVGIDQFIDLGSGLPTQDNVHQVAQRYLPDARVVYADNDPLALAHARSLLDDDPSTTIVQADIRFPEQVLDHPDLRRLVDLDQPVGLIMCAILHHLLDEENPADLVAAYRDRVPAGSHLFLTHVCVADDGLIDKLEPISIEHLGTGVFRTIPEIEEFFTGWEMLAPGVVFIPQWYPEEPLPDDPAELTEVQRMAAAGMARKK